VPPLPGAQVPHWLGTCGHDEIRNQLKKGTRIVVITIDDVCRLLGGAAFLALLQVRHAELRHLGLQIDLVIQ